MPTKVIFEKKKKIMRGWYTWRLTAWETDGPGMAGTMGGPDEDIKKKSIETTCNKRRELMKHREKNRDNVKGIINRWGKKKKL